MKNMSMETAQRLLEGHPNLMSIREVGEALCCNPRTVYRLVEEGTIECTRIGRKIVISKDTICAYLCRPVDINSYN